MASGVFSGLSADSIRLATYNLDNYLVMDRLVSGRWRPAYPKPESEKRILRESIRQVAPDILVLQEMGSVDFLEELRGDLSDEGLHYNYAVHMQGVDPVRHLAVLSKLPPHKVVKHTDLDFKYFERSERVKRGMLEMSFRLGEGDVFQLFAIHLKSRYAENKDDPESAMRRVREAEACRNRVIERTLDRSLTRFVVAGDFNDHPNSSTLRRFYQRGRLEMAERVPATDSRGETWTYHYAKEARYDAVDGFVASLEMLPWIEGGRAHIVDNPELPEGSDHRMVYMDISIPAAD